MTTPRTTKTLAALTSLVLAGVIGVGSVVGSESAADDLSPKASAALADPLVLLGGVEIEFDGREARLSNGTHAELVAAEKIVEDINGVRWATVETGPGALPDPPSLTLTRTVEGVTLSGVVTDFGIADELNTDAYAFFGETTAEGLKEITDDLTIDPGVGTADWLIRSDELSDGGFAMTDIFGSLESVNELVLRADGDSITIDGTMTSQDTVDAVNESIKVAVPHLAVHNNLTVDPAALLPEQAGWVKDSVVFFARGSSTLDAKGDEGVSESEGVLLSLVDVLARVPGLTLEIGGHAGPSDPVRGKILSDERVVAVKDFLVASGIDADRLTTKSHGSDPQTEVDPFARQYRRVDFTVTSN